MRLELTRSCDHYPLKVACIPISPPARSVRQIVLSDVATRHKAHDCLRFWHPMRKPCFLWGPRSSKNNFSSSFSSITKNTFRELKSFFECYKDHFAVPRTGLEPARLATYAPETYASTNSATWARRNSLATRFVVCTTKMSPRLLLFEKPLFAQCFFEGLQRTLSMNFVPFRKSKQNICSAHFL